MAKMEINQVFEEIIFDPSELEQIKHKINDFTNNLITAKALKLFLLQSRERIYEDFEQFFNQYEDHFTNGLLGNGKRNKIQAQLNEEIIRLKKELVEKNKLLENITHRLVDLELKFRQKFGDIAFNDEQELSLEEQRVKELLEILYDSQGNEIKNEYRFVPAFMTILHEWNEAEFGEGDGKTLSDRIVDFGFPLELQDGLIKVATIRSLIGHRKYETKKSDWSDIYKTFFMLVCHLILEMSESTDRDNDQSVVSMQKFFTKNIHDKELYTIAKDAIHTFFNCS